MFNVPMMAITEEPDSSNFSPLSLSPKSTLSEGSGLENQTVEVTDNNSNHENGSLKNDVAGTQYEIKALRRELPPIPSSVKKTCNFLTVDSPDN